jgi:hypothetical protein
MGPSHIIGAAGVQRILRSGRAATPDPEIDGPPPVS